MATTVIKTALIVLFAIAAAYSMNNLNEYNQNRTVSGKLSDAIRANSYVISHQLDQEHKLSKVNLTQRDKLRALLKDMTKMHVLKEELLKSPISIDTAIIDAVLNESCQWLKTQLQENSTCSHSEMKRLLSILELYFANEDLGMYFNKTEANCFCPWFEFNILNGSSDSSSYPEALDGTCRSFNISTCLMKNS